MTPILHDRLPFTPWADPVAVKLPGTRAAEPGDWVQVDEAFAAQMALRDRLIAEAPDRVIAMLPGAADAAGELLDLALRRIADLPGYRVAAGLVTRPDGVGVPLDRAAPMVTLGRLVQPDLCIMQPGPGGHLLTAAALCFPAGWTLREKLGHPMGRIHLPVDRYTDAMGARVERMMSHLKPGQPIHRANISTCHDPALFRPLSEGGPRPVQPPDAPYVRVERQVLFRLPQSGAVAFSIHTFMLERARLTADQARSLEAYGPHVF